MKNIILLILLTIVFCNTIKAQVRVVNSSSVSAASSSSAFIDASSNSTVNMSSNIGKGLLFPRTDLTNFGALSGSPTGFTFSYPTRFDGMIVYNTTEGTAAIGGTAVKQGFYYYENKTTNVNGGTWVRLLDVNDAGGSTTVYYGILSSNDPVDTDITSLTTTTTTSGIYDSKFDQTLSVDGYFTVAVPVSWRNPQLTLNGDETFNIFLPVKILDINGKSYQVWQSDITLTTGIVVAVN